MWSAVYRHPDSACYCHYHAHTHTKDREITCTIYCLIDAMIALLVNVWHFITVLAAAVWLYQLFCFRLPVKCQFNTMIGSSITTLGRESNFSRKAFLWLIISFYGKLFFSASHIIIWINLKRSNKAEINYWESCLKICISKLKADPVLQCKPCCHIIMLFLCVHYLEKWPADILIHHILQAGLQRSNPGFGILHFLKCTHIYMHTMREGKGQKEKGHLKLLRQGVRDLLSRKRFGGVFSQRSLMSVCYVLLCASAIKLKQWHFYSKVCSFFFVTSG